MKRVIDRVVPAIPTTDGAGVHLNRLLSLPQVKSFDPFLMLDFFHTTDTKPGPGFPWHPHRGIITITYMLEGAIEHEDSMGNHGKISAGGVQWMKAASGIIHQEMPHPSENGNAGLQFWLNLPANEKMSAPDYGDILSEDIPEIATDGAKVRVIAGSFSEKRGPLSFPITNPLMLDCHLGANKRVSFETDASMNVFLIGLDGEVRLEGEAITNGAATLLKKGTEITLEASEQGGRCMIVGGIKLEESIAWRGPIVMNNNEELDTAFLEYQQGTFIK